MKLKLDENLGRSIATHLRAADHDVHTIADEQLLGADDAKVLAAAASEGRVLVTNDLDFSDPRRYRPSDHAGIVVIRVGRQTPTEYQTAIDTLVKQLSQQSPAGQLWIVRGHMVRIYGFGDT